VLLPSPGAAAVSSFERPGPVSLATDRR